MITPATEILNQKGTPMFNSDLFANRPAAGIAGRIFISTDTKELYRDTGTTWELLSAGGGGTVTGTGTATQVAFWTGSSAISGNNDLWWDNVNDYLGIKTNSPISELDVVGQGYFHPSVTAAANAGWSSSYAFTTATIPATTFSNLGNVFCGAAGINSMTYNGDATFQQANVPAAIIGNNIFRFGSSGLTISLNQGSGLRAFSALTAFNQVQSNFTGTISHLAGVHVLAPFASNQSMNVTNYYGLLINNATERTAFTITNRWGIYQDGSSDTNYFAGRTLIRSNVDNGNALQVTGTANITNLLGVGPAGSNPEANIHVTAAINLTPEIRITGQGTGSARLRLRTLAINACEFHYSNGLNIFDTSLSTNTLVLSSAGNLLVGSNTDNGARLQVSGSATFTSDIGIGTASPAHLLHIASSQTGTTSFSNVLQTLRTGASGRDILLQFSDGTNQAYIGSISGNLYFGTGGANERFSIASTGAATFSGNVGIGVTPSAWVDFKAIELPNVGFYASAGPYVQMIANGVYNGAGNYIYKTSAQATMYAQALGEHQWFIAPSGTAGNTFTFTQAMTLDASGRLGIGISSMNERLMVNGAIVTNSFLNNNQTSSAVLDFFSGSARIFSYGASGVGGNIEFHTASGGSNSSERMRITSGGNVGIGETNVDANFRLQVKGALPAIFNNDSTANSPAYGGTIFYRPTNTLNNGVGFAFNLNNASNARSEYAYIGGLIESNTAGVENGSIIFAPTSGGNRTERMRITSGGNVLIGSATDTGNKLYLNGSLRIDGQRSGTAGGNSGQHLIITLDGIQYKIALLNP